MKTITPPLILIALFAMSASQTSFAQITFDGCVDPRGIPVASVAQPNIGDMAKAMLNPMNGAPIIVYDPMVLPWVSSQFRLFIYTHECGHHALGHALGAGYPMTMEQEADCFGIRTLIDRRLISNSDIAVIQNDMARLGRGDWAHLPGPYRAINLQLCLGRPSQRQTPQVNVGRFCCDAWGRRWCPVTINPGPIGTGCACQGLPGMGTMCN